VAKCTCFDAASTPALESNNHIAPAAKAMRCRMLLAFLKTEWRIKA
jgi:hypothetical protein